MREHTNPGLAVLGYLVTMWNARRAIHKMYDENLRGLYGAEVFETRIPHAAEYPEAIAYRKPIVLYKPRGAAARGSRPLPRRSWPDWRRRRTSWKGRRPEMGKLDELRRGAGGNAAESMGSRNHRDLPASAVPSGRAEKPRYQGLERLKGANEIPIDRLTRDPSQPREIFDEASLQELVESIESLGVLQPIRVRWDEELAMYVIIAGERRLRAAKMAGLKFVPSVIQEGELTESQRLIEQLAENIIRADLQPVEQAKAFRRLMDLNGWSARQLAREMHIADANVVRALALLELPEGVQMQVEAGRLAPSVAYEVSRLDNPDEQVSLAGRIIAEKLTRDQAIAEVQARKPGQAAAAKRARQEFRRDDGTRITISGPASAAGRSAVIAALQWALGQAQNLGGVEAGDQAA